MVCERERETCGGSSGVRVYVRACPLRYVKVMHVCICACVHGSKNLVVKHGHMASVQEYSNLQALTSVKAKDGVAHQHSIFHALYQNAFF